MAKIVEGVALEATGVILDVVGFPEFGIPLNLLGASQIVSGIAELLSPGPGLPFSVREPAAPRVTIYGEARIAGKLVFESSEEGKTA